MCSHGRCWDNQTWWQIVAGREWPETIPFVIAGHAVQVVFQSGSRNSRSGHDEFPIYRLPWTENVQGRDKDMFLHHGQAERVTQGLKARFSQKNCRSIAKNTVNLNGQIKNELTSMQWSSRSWCFTIRQLWHRIAEPWPQSVHLNEASIWFSEHTSQCESINAPSPSCRRSSSKMESRSDTHCSSLDCPWLKKISSA